MRFQKKVKLAYLKDRYDQIEKAICWSLDLFCTTKSDILITKVLELVPGVRRKDVLAVAEELRAEFQIFYDEQHDYWSLTPVNL